MEKWAESNKVGLNNPAPVAGVGVTQEYRRREQRAFDPRRETEERIEFLSTE